MQEARLGRALQWVELVWAKMAKHEGLQSKIVKWKCKGINLEGNLKQVPRWWADPCEFDDFKTGYIFGAEVDATSEVGRRGIWKRSR